MKDARDKELLLSNKITYVLNCAKESKNYHENDSLFKYCNANWMDLEEQSFSHNIDALLQFIDTAKSEGKSILVHCIIGKSRSASVVIAYLLKYNKMTLKEAYDLVKTTRPLIQPNEGY